MTPLVDLLRRPSAVVAQCLAEREQRRLARLCLSAIALGGAAFGAAVGSYRGGAQWMLASAKMPLAMLATLAICGPAVYALAAAFGRPWRFRVVLGLSLAAWARGSLARVFGR